MDEQDPDSEPMNKVLSRLFQLQVTAHMAHLQASTLARHLALDPLYSDLPELIDRLAETHQGLNGPIVGISMSAADSEDIRLLLDSVRMELVQARTSIKEGCLLQILDDIDELMLTTCYKLDRLR